MFQKDSIVIHDQWELSWAWPGLMQLISIFITPTSCAYDILDLPRHAKSTLSLYCCLSLRHSPSLSLCFLSLYLTLFLSLLMLHLTIVPLRLCGLNGHITLTPCVSPVSLSISLSVDLRSE